MLEVAVMVLMKRYQNCHDFAQTEAFGSATGFASTFNQV
jgi:hypothetical protein